MTCVRGCVGNLRPEVRQGTRNGGGRGGRQRRLAAGVTRQEFTSCYDMPRVGRVQTRPLFLISPFMQLSRR